jgi:hypothetical protein
VWHRAEAAVDDMDSVSLIQDLEAIADQAIRFVGSAIKFFGVLVIVSGIAWATWRYLLGSPLARIRKSTRPRSAAPCCLASKFW